MEVYESRHKIGFPLKDRVFTFLTIAGAPEIPTEADDGRCFYVLTVPIIPPPSATSRDKEGDGASVFHFPAGAKDVVHGAYVAVEYVRERKEGGIEWVMATASDARGTVPKKVQALAVPGKVVKDVELVLKFLERRRGKERGAAGAVG